MVNVLRCVPDTLEISSLSKSYGKRPVLEDIDLTIPSGSITAITGANGCGKSTLLRCIAGLAAHSGAVTYRGMSLEQSRGDLGYLPQSPGLPSWATVGEVLAFFARLRGCALGNLPLPDGFVPAADRQIAVLSGGQRQRVALAVALLGGPSLLLLDEPSANLDDPSRATLWSVLAEAAAGGATVLVATPIDADLALLPRSVVEIVDGRLVPPVRRSGQAGHPSGTEVRR